MREQLPLSAGQAPGAPLADRMRPVTLDEFVGQGHLLAPGKPLRVAIERGFPLSCLLWGPPGTGKTTLARILAQATKSEFVPFSAVLGGVRELRKIIEEARKRRDRQGRGTILFVDEIHRFNKSQQDAFLPHVESGLVTLIGATTENPSFELNAALLSRLHVYVLTPLTREDLVKILLHALENPVRGLGKHIPPVTPEALEAMAVEADGDARRALNLLEEVVALHAQHAPPEGPIGLDTVRQAVGEKALRYDRASEEHYNVISAFIKSLRGSDPDAAEYWLARMIEGGEDPRFICRRLVVFASEDIGNADPRALQVAVAAFQALELVGLPEGLYNLSQAVLYLAMAPKSNSAKTAYFSALADVKKYGSLPVPVHIRNAPTRLLRDMGHGAGYKYPHDYPHHYVPQTYLPDALVGRRYVKPSGMGFERRLEERLEWLRKRQDSDDEKESE